MENIKDSELFKKGFFEGIPIGLGYIPLGVALGITAVKTGFVFWLWSLMSFCVYSGSAIAAVMNLMAGGETVILTYLITFFIVNCRYMLLSLSMAQKLDPKMNTFQRVIFSFFNTDEIFAVAMQKKGYLKASYLFGISVIPYSLMMAGSVLGFLMTNLMPPSVSSAFGITLYAMFIALIVPPCRNSKSALFAVLFSAILNVILANNSFARNVISPGWSMMFCAVVSAAITAVLFPIKNDDSDSKLKKEDA
ncbi:MAG: AzlC family ABC transporter permease [Candidatus Improbicoccus pseudotrichonymphae]|uniref:AzlC family ABC transporter permease n=1 Tax=Candidatus Improbicoccus pseudotrichonymphae TaxID=3033792 RepID=A0AA48HYH1_9FIRM|nr:MAG: AzlC family ABC transporter permease [Candidatus Improbicoccus pseudotrichonymphae]